MSTRCLRNDGLDPRDGGGMNNPFLVTAVTDAAEADTESNITKLGIRERSSTTGVMLAKASQVPNECSRADKNKIRDVWGSTNSS
eukprot:7920673-Prorocentrum_lima.AAC.1